MPRMPILERFMQYVATEPNTGCWLWFGARNRKNRYGYFSTGHSTASSAHRVSYELHKGPIPEGLDLDHLCRMRCCVNPDHLEPVTRKENLLRGLHPPRLGGKAFAAMQRAKTHCFRGHEYNEENTRWVRHVNGEPTRKCRECRRMSARMRRNRKGV